VPADQVRPLALLFAENILTDMDGKRTLVGLLNGISAPKYPVALVRLVVYLLIETPPKAVPLEMVIRSDQAEIVRQNFVAELQVPPESEFGFFLMGVEWPAPGRYTCQILQDGIVIAERVLTANPTDTQAEKEKEARACSRLRIRHCPVRYQRLFA
jgi:hypothetical protein